MLARGGVRRAGNLPRLRHVIVSGGDAPPETLSLEGLLAAASDELSPADTTPDDACFWLYSSGTTGFPKGAVHLQHDMIYCCETYGASVLATTERDRHFTVSPLFHADQERIHSGHDALKTPKQPGHLRH